jgi:hypothetical protein
MEFAGRLQGTLFGALEQAAGELSEKAKLLIAVLTAVPPQAHLPASRGWRGRPAKHRQALATAFLAKAVYGLETTRQLIDRLRCDRQLLQLCGWNRARQLPSESTFSRAFEEFAKTELPQRLHEAVIDKTQRDRLIGHIARDSTAIPARQRCDQVLEQKKESTKDKRRKKSKGRKKHAFARKTAAERGTRMQQQRHQKLDRMLQDLPRACDIGAKTNSQGNEQYWRGYKLHLDVADGQLPVSAVLTSASVHDSQVAIPLMTITSQRVTHLYELMDSAYDADAIHQHSRQLNHVPIIAPHPRRGTKKSSQLPKVFPDKPTPQLTWAQQDRYKLRSMSERVNARLKDEFGASHLRVRGAAKVMAHLMFGVLALTVDQWLRLSAPG